MFLERRTSVKMDHSVFNIRVNIKVQNLTTMLTLQNFQQHIF